MHAVSIDLWVLPVTIVAVLLGWFGASGTAAFMRARGWANVAPTLGWLLMVTLAVGRFAFVARWWPAYHASACVEGVRHP